MRVNRPAMEITYQLSLALVAVFGLLGAGMAMTTKHRDTAIWLGFAATVMAALSFFAWLQDYLWKQDAEAAKQATATLPRPRILFVEDRLIPPSNENEPVRIAFGLMNRGDADGTATIKDRTYYFSTDPSQKRFKYQTSSPEVIRVAAIPNAIWRGEMRFDFRFTAEKLAALKSGAARLFFFARGGYSDEAGNTYPLPFAEMYDSQFPGNLVACPSDIVFE